MNVLVVDDEKLALDNLCSSLKAAELDASIFSCSSSTKALALASQMQIDVAFLDIQIPGMNGIMLAKELKKLNSKMNIIFVTAYPEYGTDAFELFASGYLLKPIKADDIRKQFENLRFPILNKSRGIYFRTFGKFELLVDGKPIHFRRNDAKELLACLIDENKACTKKELGTKLFMNHFEVEKLESLTKNLQEMKSTLKEAGIEEILIYRKNHYELNPKRFSCDLYDFREGKAEALNAFQGEYMLGYAWAENTRNELLGRDGK